MGKISVFDLKIKQIEGQTGNPNYHLGWFGESELYIFGISFCANTITVNRNSIIQPKKLWKNGFQGDDISIISVDKLTSANPSYKFPMILPALTGV